MPIKFLRLFVFVVSYIFINPACFSKTPTNNIELSLTPLACFVKQPGDLCHITVNVTWKSQALIDACLYQHAEKLRCWVAKRSAKTKILISLSENMQFTLQGDNGEVYAQQHVTIATSISKKYRRRLRADWSLF